MEYLKQLYINRNKTVWLLSVSIFYSLLLFIVTVKVSNSFFFLILIWNLFLAVLPLIISTFLIRLKKLNNIGFAFTFCIWLLLLPNAPYIITDLIHLKISDPHMLWLDALLIASFAFNGLMLFYFSINDMKTLMSRFINKKWINYTVIAIIFSTSFGVYLGRFLRHNSWEVLSNPKYLLLDIVNIITYPLVNQEAWLFTILFGLFLCVGNVAFKSFYSNPST